MPVKYPNAKQFKRELDGDRLERLYLFLGEEEGEKDKCINRIMVMAFNDPFERSHASCRFHMENDEFMTAADFVLSPSMFSSRRVCVMYNIDALRAPAAARFRELVNELPDSAILILTTREIRPPAFMNPLLERFKVVQFWRYFDNDIHTYVRVRIQKLGLALDERAVELLIERTGNDIKKIDDAIDMIRFSGESGRIDEAAIRNFIEDVKEVSVFDFIDALFKREPRALGLFKKLHEEGTPELRVVYQILRQAEMIEQYYTLTGGGVPPEEAMTKAGVYSKNRDSFWRYTESFPRERLRRVFTMVSAVDQRLKSGGLRRELVANPLFTMVTDMLYAI
ncbi:MAG TPA: DNA polymerase III subunit delta [Spirochaetota bacterium]|nr:DNA polymerase III subunit delta [Spirochaetota bacterium]HOD14530.1 DNA polymerase III subunit delta [Spirochaetota bacterium]HPG49573.1 DNA polymerase III subunit delta [Spirochaetota bacterium]HQL80893.1 DNA polymerase III subunit delta [Spirochaetota bacterium]